QKTNLIGNSFFTKNIHLPLLKNILPLLLINTMAMNECADCNRGGQPGRLSDCLHCSRRLCPTCLAGHGRELRKQALDLHAAAVGRLAELANGEARNRERAAAVAFFDEAAAALEDRRQRVLDRLAGHGELDDLLDECGRALRAVDTDDTADSDGGRTNGADKTEAVEEEEDMEELVRLVRLLTPLSGRLAGPEGPVCCLEEAQSRLYDLIDAVDYAIEAADADGFGSLGLDFEADVNSAEAVGTTTPSSATPSPMLPTSGGVGVGGSSLVDDFDQQFRDADPAAVASAPHRDELEFWETDAVAMESRLRPRKKKRRGKVETDSSCQTFKAEGRPVSLTHLLGKFYAVETQPVKCVRVYNQGGNFLSQLQFKGEPAETGPKIDPYRLVACAVREWLLLVDNRNGCLLTVWPSGYAERRIGPAVSAKYSLSRPEDAATDGELIFVCCPRIGVFIFSCSDDSVRATLPQTDPGCPVRLTWCPGPRILVATLRCKSNRYEFLVLEVTNPGGKNPVLLPLASESSAKSDNSSSVSLVSAAQPALVAIGDRLVCTKSAENDSSAGCLMSLDLSAAGTAAAATADAAVCLFKTQSGLLADLCEVTDSLAAACDPRRNVILLFDLEKLRL
ncbi:hypothetical protein BOX15_Mlig008166g3, partial [Macrostomum lignano]